MSNSPSRLKNRPWGSTRVLLPLLLLFLCSLPMLAQEKVKRTSYFPQKQHMIGIRGGYALTGARLNPVRDSKMVSTLMNNSILYTYYHDLWGRTPYFGFQTGITYRQSGYKSYATQYMYDIVQVPMTSQFHVDFWRMRLLIDIGMYVGYRLSGTRYALFEDAETGAVTVGDGTPIEFDANSIRLDYGLGGGVGLAYAFNPFELQLEGNFNYSMLYLENPAALSNEYYAFNYPFQIVITLGLFFHF